MQTYAHHNCSDWRKMDDYNYIIVLFYGMNIFSEEHTYSTENRELKEQLKTHQLHLSETNLEKQKIIEEMRLQSKINKHLVENIQHAEQEKKSLEEILLHV